MKRFAAILLALGSLLFALRAQAAGEIKIDNVSTGQTVYLVLKSQANQALTTGTTFAAYTTTRADFDQALAEVSTTGLYSYDFPAVAAGSYTWTIYQDADDDGTPSHDDDIPLAEGSGYWTGTALVDNLAAYLLTTMIRADGGEFEFDPAAVEEVVGGGGGANSDPTWVDDDHAWSFDDRSQTTSPDIISERIGFDGLVALEPRLSPRVAIDEDTAVTVSISPATGGAVVAPTLGTPAVHTSARKINLAVDATLATANTYTITWTFTTTDGQVMVRKGIFELK